MLRRLCLILLVSLPSSLYAGGYPTVEHRSIAMSDGILLNTDIYYPQDGQDPWPVILYRTPYGIAGDNVSWVTGAGYVAVCQDTRGRFGSQGVDRLFMDDGWGPDHQDGLETAQWILQQPWCNQKIGTLGGSARGITQNQLAGALPPNLRCQYVVVAPSSMYHYAVFPGGALRERDIVGWITGQGSAHLLDSLAVHPSYDAWWSWLDSGTRDASIDVPTYQQGGWYDLFADGQVQKFRGLQNGGAPGALGNQKLIMGPWTHGGGSGELQYPANSSLENAQALIGSQGAWFDHWMNGAANGVLDLPPVAYYMMGDVDDAGAPGNEWRTADEWPPPGFTQSWFLRGDGSLGRELPSAGDPPATFEFDPFDPVPTRGGCNLSGLSGPYDQRPVESRPDVLLYTSPVLAEGIEIAGTVRMELFASSDRIDTDFTAKLTDVYPDGRSMLVCDGILRARHRVSMDREDFLTPGVVYRFDIRVGETAIAFAPGHRIRLAISSSNHDRFDVNPNTGAPFAYEYGEMLTAHNTVNLDAVHPSRLLLPVVGQPSSVPTGSAADAPRLILSSPNPTSDGVVARLLLAREERVRIDVLDVAGRHVARLGEPLLGAGDHEIVWDGRDTDGTSVPSGVYWLKTQDGRVSTGLRVVIVR